jgi:glycosyltransferase involved in cell wall biosynthesis
VITNLENKRVLVFCDYYLPGYKSGGGMRTIANMIDRLGDRYEFFIITRDYDGPLDTKQYKNVKIDEWNEIGKANVYYVSSGNFKSFNFLKLLKEIKPSAIYLNSVFGKPARIVMLLRKLGFLKQQIILAPEGELSIGAKSNKAFLKNTYIRLKKLLGLYDDIIWKVCSELEGNEVKQIKGNGGEIFDAPNMSPSIILPKYKQVNKPVKEVGVAKLVFLSRFARKKNFKWFLENVGQIEGKLIVDIIAPIEDFEYWNECLELIQHLPTNIIVSHIGSIPYEDALEKLVGYHFFLLPTLGENFGHVFIEGLSAGCPIISSDRTPWLNLEKKGIGWDIPLEKPEMWVKILNECVAMNNEEYSKLSIAARAYAVDWLSDKKLEEATDAVLKFAISGKQNLL